MDYFIQGIYSFFACLFFAIIYNTPRQELLSCGITGGIGYGVSYYFLVNNFNNLFSIFMGAFFIVVCARIISVNTKHPVMLYVLPAIFTLVPGANMYNAMYAVLTNNLTVAVDNALEAFKISGIIVLALILMMTVPKNIFEVFIINKKQAL